MLEQNIIINSESKIPLYLQLKEQIKNYITSGQAQEDEQLPPVNTFSNKLGIHFETVRKAYKDLENDGYIVMKRGLGSFFNLNSINHQKNIPNSESKDFNSVARDFIRNSLKEGKYLNTIKEEFLKILDEVANEYHGQKIIFTECSTYQTEGLSDMLHQFLNCSFTPHQRDYIEVRGILVQDLKDFLMNPNNIKDNLNVVTTGFHYEEVKKLVGKLPINVHALITHMSRETRQKLTSFGDETKYAFISSNKYIANLILDIFKEELGDVKIEYCTIDDKEQIKNFVDSEYVILVPPAVYKEMKELAPPDYPLIKVFDIVDPMSLNLLKDRIFSEH